MKRKLLITLLSAFAFAGSLQAAADYLLEIDGVKGESVDDAHKGTIDVLSWSWGMSNTTSTGTGGAGVGKVSFQDFHFTTKGGKASPQLMLACATGKHIPKAILYVRKSGGDRPLDYYKITMSDVLVSSFQQSGQGGGTSSQPDDSVKLYFTSIKIEHTDDSGEVTEGTSTILAPQ